MGFWLGWTGLALAVVLAIADTDFDRESRTNWAILSVVLLVVPISARVLFRRAVKTLGRHRRVLVPLGLRVGVLAGMSWLLAQYVWTRKSIDIHVLTIAISVPLVATYLVETYYASWTTLLLMEAGREDRCSLGAQARRAFRLWPRTFVLLLIGHGVPLLVTVGLVWAFGLSIPMTLGIAAFVLLWNTVACGLLLVGLEAPGHLGHAIAAAFRRGLRRSPSVFGAVLVYLLLVGWLFVSYTSTHDAGRSVRSMRVDAKLDFTGGYYDTCHWADRALIGTGEFKLPIVALVVTLAYSFFALAVKLEIARRLHLLRSEGARPPE